MFAPIASAYDHLGGRARCELSHVLKVFLIDRAGDVREIYSALFLHPQTVLNDIETLLMEEGRRRRREAFAVAAKMTNVQP